MSKSERKAIFGLFRTRNEIKATQRALEDAGFSNREISVLYPLHRGPQDFPQRQRSSIETGALVGAAAGGIVFLVIGVLANLASVSVPALERVEAVNPLLLILMISLGGVFLARAAGALIGIGTPEPASQRYGDYVDAGGILMSVHVKNNEEVHKARELFEKVGAQEIHLLNEGRDWETVYSKVIDVARARYAN